MMVGGSRSACREQRFADIGHAVVNRHLRPVAADPRSARDRVLVVRDRHDRPGQLREQALDAAYAARSGREPRSSAKVQPCGE